MIDVARTERLLRENQGVEALVLVDDFFGTGISAQRNVIESLPRFFRIRIESSDGKCTEDFREEPRVGNVKSIVCYPARPAHDLYAHVLDEDRTRQLIFEQ